MLLRCLAKKTANIRISFSNNNNKYNYNNSTFV